MKRVRTKAAILGAVAVLAAAVVISGAPAALGWLGIFALVGENRLDGKFGRVEGYPGDKPFGTHWKMSGFMKPRSDKKMLYYNIDTAGGQSGSPIFKRLRPSCGGPCGMGVHSYGASGNPPLNSGPRITTRNFDTIVDVIANN